MDRAHREFTDAQIAFLAALVRLYRGDDLEGYTFDPTGLNLTDIQITTLRELFVNPQSAIGNPHSVRRPRPVQSRHPRRDRRPGLEPEPRPLRGRGRAADDDGDWREQLEALNEELEVLNAEARELEERIGENVAGLLEEFLRIDGSVWRRAFNG